MKQESFPARLHALVPAESDNAIVIRRGPSRHTCVLSWNTSTDAIEPAQWLKGRIYERRSDISPNGKHWIYFAMNGRWTSELKGSWTAIARTPWLKAVGLFAKGDCWHGGGLFLGKEKYWLNDGCGHETLLQTTAVKRSENPKDLQYFGGERLTVYYNRLMRDGWSLTDRTENGRHDAATIFEKELPHGWLLRKVCHEQVGAPKGRSCYWDEHVLISKNGSAFPRTDWEWAEMVDDRIAYAARGCLFRVGIRSASDLGDERPIHDFNGYEFERLEAPY